MGNFAGNHKEIWEVMERYPGIVIPHDQLMQNFFIQAFAMKEYGGDEINGFQKYSELMSELYGEVGKRAAAAKYPGYFNDEGPIWNSAGALEFPMVERLFKSARGLFIHSGSFAESAREKFNGPIQWSYLPLPLPNAIEHPPENLPAIDLSQKFLLVATGIVHPVKNIKLITDLLARDPELREKIAFVVIGEYGGSYGNELKSLGDDELKGNLYLLGFQPQEVMDWYLSKADACVNLRFPNSEVCSKSLLEQMAYAKPVLAFNTGIFSEVPDDAIVKVDREKASEQIGGRIRLLIEDVDLRESIGKRARQFVAEECTLEKYTNTLENLLEQVNFETPAVNMINRFIDENSILMAELGISPWQAAPAYEDIVHIIQRVISRDDPSIKCELKTLGIWFGFPYKASLRREGITKFLNYLAMALTEFHDVSIEIWCYSFNAEEMIAGFPSLLSNKNNQKVKLITENNFSPALDLNPIEKVATPEVTIEKNNLIELAKKFSKADAFITSIVYLDNLVGFDKQLFVPLHDLNTHTFYNNFIRADPAFKSRHIDIHSRAERFARNDAFFFSNSQYVRETQVLANVRSVLPSRSKFIYLPVNIPDGLSNTVFDRELIRRKYNLPKNFLFYATQLRPYKNVPLVLKAIAYLKKTGQEISLVLTGDPYSDPECARIIRSSNLEASVVSIGTVDDQDLYRLYDAALGVVVPSLFEGGFPWQACEALFMNKPLALSDIPVSVERIEFHGFTKQSSGLLFFDPGSVESCADAISRLITDPVRICQSQDAFRKEFLKYSWQDAADVYYNTMNSVLSNPGISLD